MEETEMSVLDAMLDNLVVAVFGHKDRLMAQTDVQDIRIKKMWDAYVGMGINYPQYTQEMLEPIRASMIETQSDAAFFEKYKQTAKDLERVLSQLKDRDNPIEILRQAEKLINDLFILLHFQWELLSSQMQDAVKKVRSVRDAELALLAEYKKRKPGLENHPSGPSITQMYGMQQQQLIADQIEGFTKEKDIMDQMQVVVDERERLLNISSELFLK